MGKQTSPQGLGLTPVKGALIAVLAVVLVGVLYTQFSGGDGAELSEGTAYKPPKTTPRPTPRATADAAKPEATTVVKEAKATLTTFDPTLWESPELSAVIAYDPFARPETFPKPKVMAEGKAEVAISAADAEKCAKELADAVEKSQKQLQQLQQRGVHMIVRRRDQGGYVAVIGDRTVHVGDTIDGFTVTAIEPDGVQVEQAEVE